MTNIKVHKATKYTGAEKDNKYRSAQLTEGANLTHIREVYEHQTYEDRQWAEDTERSGWWRDV